MQAWLRMVERLRESADWPADELPVEIKQTHISVILLGRNTVIKLKKPVDFGFLDYTTLSRRLRACEDEVRLNRRLCSDAYLGIAAIIDIDGRIHLRRDADQKTGGAPGPASGASSSEAGEKIIDYGVLMRRLPDERMLDQLIRSGQATEAMIERIADRVSQFHRAALRGPEVSRWGSLAEVRYNWDENFEQSAPYIGRTISAPDFDAIRDWVERWFAKEAELFERRVREGRIVDGHGDLRCESICLQDDSICIYDCIEFNDRFRCDDVASEVAFLAMDLDARARPDLGYFFTEAYQRRAMDPDLFKLLPFYRCYRAFVRGKVLSFRLDKDEFSAEEKRSAATRAAAYFELSRRYAARLEKPAMIAVTGLSGTGKTTVARAIGGELGLRVVSADEVRQSIFGAAKKAAAYGEGVYTAEATRRTYEEMIRRASELLAEEGGVILDATFIDAELRRMAREAALGSGARWRVIDCRLDEQAVRERLARRAESGEGLSDATWEIYLQQRRKSGYAADAEGDDLFILDTSGSRAAAGRAACDWLRRRDAASED